MRIFIGIPFKEQEKERLGKIQKIVMERSEGGRFSDPQNFHLTLKFIGEIQGEKLEEIRRVLKKITKKSPSFKLVLQGFGTFPKGKTHIPWLGVREGQENLAKLEKEIQENLEKIGFEKESRPFRPHMTFGRKVRLSSSNETYLEKALAGKRVSLEADSIAIMESTRRKGKLVYPLVESFPLEISEN